MGKLNVNQFSNKEERQQHYLSEVDRLAEQVRSNYVTTGSGQAMTYEIKYQEALRGGGPLLQSEAIGLGMTLQEVVDSVLSARTKWLALAEQIETARLQAKQTIRASNTAAEMHSAVIGLKGSLGIK